MTSLSACVIPVGPRFEDPPGQENFAPEIENADPLQGGVVTVPSNTAKKITITVTDPNAFDDLYIRWIAEYPPYTINSTYGWLYDATTGNITANTSPGDMDSSGKLYTAY